MRRTFAVSLLALVFSMNLGTGVARQIDHRIFKIESCLYDKLEDRSATDCLMDQDRRYRSRHHAIHDV